MTDLRESGALQATKVSGTRYRARLIEGDRWGSSGYYPREVLERDGPNVWPESTQIYLDHPTEREDWERPERSVRDLAGKITSTPVYESDGLYADVEFYPHTAPVLEAIWGDVGMSIRAAGTTESGERDGRSGPIITSLSEGLSVDVVTRAGAGGKLVALLESARGESRPQEPAPAPAGEETTPSATKEAAEMADTKNTENTSRVEEADSELERLRAENAALKAEIAELKKAKAKEARRVEVANIVEEAFDGVDPGMVKDLLIDRLAESDTTGDDLIKEARTFAEDYKTKTASTGQVRGLGESRPINTDTNVTESELPSYDELTALKGA